MNPQRTSIFALACFITAFAIASIAAPSGLWAQEGDQATTNQTLASQTQPQKPLNILFLVSDDLRPELGCYGVKEIQSPNIDELASAGVVFRNAYCQQAVCSPSRTSVMTGMRPDWTGVTDLRTHFRKALPDVVTLPQFFKEHGYVSQGLGKIYHGSALDDAPSWSANNRLGQTEEFKVSLLQRREKNIWQDQDQDEDETKIPLTKTDRGNAFRKTDDPKDGGGEGRLADEAIAALREFKKGDKPFFLGVGFRKPHLPFSIPRHYWDLYDPAEIPMATNRFLPRNAPDFTLVEKNEMWKYSGVPDTADLPDEYARQLKHGYYAAVSYMDAQLGRVLDELHRLELADNTIIVLWGDHGWKLGEHNRWCKHSNVEDDTRAPLIISAPEMVVAGQSTHAIVEFVDIYPTLVDLAGMAAPDHLQGKSLKPLLEDPTANWERVAMSQYHRKVNKEKLMGYSMRTDRYRLTRWVALNDHSKLIAEELYDHETDPQENTNIANEAEHEAVLKTLTKRWQEKLDSFKPQKNN